MTGRIATRRSWRWAAAGAGMVALGALAAAWSITAATERTPVAVAARDVPVGQVIGERDLVFVEAAGLPEAGFPQGAAEDVVGRRAAVPLREGTPVPAGALTDAEWPRAGRAVVAASLPEAAVPHGAQMGTQVQVVLTGAAEPLADTDGDADDGEDGEGEGGGAVPGRVHALRTGAGPGGDETLVHLNVAEQDAPAVASAASSQSLRLAVVSGEPAEGVESEEEGDK
ncbi:SAF domain-containing protein [Nocardiopsis chromatogenes]|uniref:SAF domain-containing protein n=1 Tax=Nocardiopsis chromatogenes TaxID=280239 RepID=UPI001EF9D1B2|nr:SAF domain-containing protein [Nocardiopsis chromatogenes]